MKIHNNLLLFFIFIWSSLATAQDGHTPTKIIPPSPTASWLGKYGEVSVGYYSGSPAVSIPIYTIKTKDNELDIKLNYSSGGVRVAEDASWVGLGWSLFAGGLITRTVRGIDDFDAHGYFYSKAFPIAETGEYTGYRDANFSSDDRFTFDQIKRNALDSEPDVFAYNFGDFSGRFVLDKLANGSKVLMDAQNNLKMEYIPYYFGDIANSDMWTVTDSRGYKYIFKTKESCEDYSYSSPYNQLLNKVGLSSFATTNNSPVTSWYLDYIISPNGESINFEYEYGKSWSLSPINFSETKYHLLNLSWGGCGDRPSFGDRTFYNASRQIINDVRLKKIRFNTGSIDFNTSDRDDVEYVTYFGGGKPQKLSQIIVKDLNGQETKKLNLNYTYFNQENTNPKRLKLDEVKECSSFSTDTASYLLSYFDPQYVPDKTSLYMDHWGFYNNTSNGSLLPEAYVPVFDRNFEGSNRMPSQDLDLIRPGTLSSIRYPTGGMTSFDYELNEFRDPSKSFYDIKGGAYYLTSIPGQPSQTSVSFNVTETKKAIVSLNYYNYDQTSNSWVDYAYLTKDGQYYATYNNMGFNSIEGEDFNLTLPPGEYVLHINQYVDRYAMISIAWRDKVPLTQVKGAGLRLKSITNSDNGQIKSFRKFLYTSNNESTGKLIVYPRYDFYFYSQEYEACAAVATYYGRMSSSFYGTGLSAGNFVGYDKVTELIGENGEGGRNEYFYINEYAAIENIPLPVQFNVQNGKLDSVINYTAAGQKAAKVEYTYDIKSWESIQGVKMLGIDLGSHYTDDRLIYYYDNPSRWYVCSSVKKISYVDGLKIINSENYYYDDRENKLLTRKVSNRSNGDSILTEFKYAKDFLLQAPYQSMYARHIWEPIIETKQYIKQGRKFLKSHKTNYADWGNSIIAPINEEITIGEASNIDIQYNKYDNTGNLLNMSKANGPKTSFIYSYGGAYLIGKIENAEYSSIESALGISALESFRNNIGPSNGEIENLMSIIRNHPDFKKSKISTYIYKPLIGLVSTTDPKGMITYYEYDVLQRLKSIKDQQGNVVSSYNYHYRPKSN